ncbi:response regulator [Sphingomonas jaspsi]|uniref:response regulator n=1 Tax=Sphingomonas jaspsi TaxID=392409 RepID=UPI00146FC48D|nr:response regulator [Sphingomonas jaspsi]
MNVTPSPVRPPRLLIVEPSASALRVMAKRLGEAGYRVIGCPNSADALAEMHRQKIDLVVAELRMASLSGIDLTRMIRADTVIRETPVVLVAGRSDKSGAIDGFGAGADDVVAKPFHFEVLIARIARRLARAAAIERLHLDRHKLDERVTTRAIELGELRDRLKASEAERLRLSQIAGRA